MKSRDWIRLACTGAFLLVLCAGTTAWAAHVCPDGYEGRGCSPTTDDCANVDDTTVTAQVGGEGSVGTEDSCTDSPAKDAAGNIVEADITFNWVRTGETTGELTITALNQTCLLNGAPDNDKATIMDIWFNTPAEFGDCQLKTAVRNGTTNVCKDADCTAPQAKGWELDADAVGEGCLGEFDWQLKAQGKPSDFGALPHDSIVFEMDCTGSNFVTNGITACDVANDGSAADPGERTAQVALHFQQLGCQEQSGDLNCPFSNKVSSNCQDDLFVNLASFEATPADGEVQLAWSTHLEIDNAGFFIMRRNVLTGEIVRLNDGLIPAEGDIFEGGHYEFLDRTAVNGVQYEYLLNDVDFYGAIGIHDGVLSVANPRNPRIRLLGPDYGSAELRGGTPPTFAWDGATRRMTLLISTDPTFMDRSAMMAIQVNGAAGSLTLNPHQTWMMENLARTNHDSVYWTVMEPTIGSRTNLSATSRVGYGVLSEAGEPAPGRPSIKKKLTPASVRRR